MIREEEKDDSVTETLVSRLLRVYLEAHSCCLNQGLQRSLGTGAEGTKKRHPLQSSPPPLECRSSLYDWIELPKTLIEEYSTKSKSGQIARSSPDSVVKKKKEIVTSLT